MIVSVDGVLHYKGHDGAIVRVGDVGLWIHSSSSTLNHLASVNSKISLLTFLYVREDTLALYGFATNGELTLFKKLISVSGIGPKAALALLSGLSVERLSQAIVNGDVDSISCISGVGKKMANRIVMELKDKLEFEGDIIEGLSPGPNDNDVVVALTSLGYSAREAIQAVSSIPDAENMNVEDKIKLALQQLMSG
jgi:holliday junction DNA helicase RuvA